MGRWMCFLLFISFCVSRAEAGKIEPVDGGVLFGAYVDSGPGADSVDAETVESFQLMIGKKTLWTYFSNNWLSGEILFPWKNVKACEKSQTVPYIRMMPWNEMRPSGPDNYYKMRDFAEGVYDLPLKLWAQEAKTFGQPMMIEFGPEVNGNWFAWNGQWNGAGSLKSYGDPFYPDGPEVFRDAYRRIINLFRSEGALNVTWVFHVDVSSVPNTWWNEAVFYYPGDDYIDWIGLSVFGAQLPSHGWSVFSKKYLGFSDELAAISLDKPVLIAEFGVIEDKNRPLRKARWLQEALQSIRLDPRMKQIKGISYWNSPGWLASGQASFKLDSSPQALKAFKEEISHPFWLSGWQKKGGPQ